MAATKRTSATTKEARTPSFLACSTTHVVIALRLFLVLAPYLCLSFVSWINRPSILSVLVRPHQQFSHLREARAIQALALPNGTSVYHINDYGNIFLGAAYMANDTIRIPPLLLTIISPLLDTPYPELWLSFILFMVDLGIAYLLEQISINVLILAAHTFRIQQEEERQRVLPDVIRPEQAHIFPIYSEENEDTTTTIITTPLISMSSIPRLAALLYFASPFTILPASLYGCWQNVPTLFLLASIYEASCDAGLYALCSWWLALATYMEPFCAVYAIPVILLLFHTDPRRSTTTNSVQEKSIRSATVLFVAFFFPWVLCLHGWTMFLLGPKFFWKAIQSVYGETWLTTSPNLSLQWYFRMQLFARFRHYFGAIFLGIPYVLVGPLTIRLWKYPEVLVSGEFSFDTRKKVLPRLIVFPRYSVVWVDCIVCLNLGPVSTSPSLVRRECGILFVVVESPFSGPNGCSSIDFPMFYDGACPA
jgi:hypothetical protein